MVKALILSVRIGTRFRISNMNTAIIRAREIRRGYRLYTIDIGRYVDRVKSVRFQDEMVEVTTTRNFRFIYFPEDAVTVELKD